MAFTFELNRIFDRTVDLILDWKDRMVANGVGTVLQSADGNALAPANIADLNGDILSVASSINGTPNNIGNTLCWARIQLANGRELLLQHGFFTGQNGYSMWYSHAAGFVQEAIGPISATVRPTASDEVQIMGSSGLSTTASNRPFFSDGLGGGTGLGSDFTGRQIAHYCWGDADEDFSFYALSWIRGAREMRGGIFMDIPAVPIAPTVDAAIIGIIGDENNPLAEFSGLWNTSTQDGTPDTSNRRAYCWYDAVNSGPNAGRMHSAVIQNLNQQTTPSARYEGQNNPYSYPARGIVVGASDFSPNVLTEPAYDDFGPVVWELGWNQTSFNPGRYGLIGLSRLFKRVSNASRYRDITSDLLWRFAGSVAIRWDGVTDLRIA